MSEREREMKRATQIAAPSPFSLLLLFLLLSQSEGSSPGPSPWPDQFHALLYMNLTTTAHLQITHLWYEWPKGRNFNIMQKQLGVLLYDLEWNNGTSYYYTLGDHGTCNVMEFEVGIPRPDWLQGANYLGQEYTDGFLCNVWEKLDFIWYYEDVVTKRPVHWDFYDGISTHVMTFEVGAVLDDSHWQAPAYCFRDTNKTMKQRDPIPTAKDEINISEREMLDFSTRKLILGSYHQ